MTNFHNACVYSYTTFTTAIFALLVIISKVAFYLFWQCCHLFIPADAEQTFSNLLFLLLAHFDSSYSWLYWW